MAAETGHAASRVYLAEDGSLHLNSGKVFDASETDITTNLNLSGSVTATPTELNKLAGVVAGTTSASKALVVDAQKTLDVLTVTTLTAPTAVDQRLRLSPQPTDTYSATMTIDVTFSYHIIAADSATSASPALTPSAAGTAGDLIIIRTTAATNTVTATFSSTFHSSGTQATTVGAFSTIMFVSDGTRWLEIGRTTAMA